MPDTDEIARSGRRVPCTPAADPNAEEGSGLKKLERPLRVLSTARSWLRFAFDGAMEEEADRSREPSRAPLPKPLTRTLRGFEVPPAPYVTEGRWATAHAAEAGGGAPTPGQGNLRQRPRLFEGESWLSNNDYPARSMREDSQGTVIARLRISPQGRVTDCAIVRSSGDTALDQRTCSTALSRGRYHPALDADGRPVAALVPVVVRWRISSG